jgi:hypothetical protein
MVTLNWNEVVNIAGISKQEKGFLNKPYLIIENLINYY